LEGLDFGGDVDYFVDSGSLFRIVYHQGIAAVLNPSLFGGILRYFITCSLKIIFIVNLH